MLKKNKILLVLLLTIFCLSVGSSCAADIDAQIITDNQAVIDDNTEINEEQINVENEEVSKVDAASKPVEDTTINEVSKSYTYYETFDDIIEGALRYKNYVEKNKKLPKTVKVGKHTYSNEDFTYLMAKAIQNSNKGDFSAIQIKSLKSYNSLNYKVNVTLPKEEYLYLVNFDLDWVVKNQKHPNYINISETSYIRYDTYSYGFAKILVLADENGYKLPNTCVFDSSIFNSQSPGSNGSDTDHNSSTELNNKNVNNIQNNHRFSTLPNTGNPILGLLFALAVLPILRIKK